MSKYVKVDDLLEFCYNQKNRSISPNDFLRMNLVDIEIQDGKRRLIDANELKGYLFANACGCKEVCNYHCDNCIVKKLARQIDAMPTIVEAST